MNLTELSAKIRVTGAEAAKRAVEGVGRAMTATGHAARGMGTAGKGVATVFAAVASASANPIGRMMQLTQTIGTLTAAMGALAAAAGFQVAAKMDSLTRGLASVSVNAQDLQAQLSRLKDVAKLPGLGFEEAVQGSVALQSAGLSASMAERSLMAFGNALATVGKGKAELQGITLAIQQISAKGKVFAEEINQINERLPQIRQAMKQ
ncbi:MAG: tape measure protein, partial [Armatimonadota bacterium]